MRLVEQKWFTLDEPEAIDSLENLVATTKAIKPGKNIPFPQADTLGTVIATIELYAHEATTTRDVSTAMDFDERQGSYYSSAAEWLGFVAREGNQRGLTEQGQAFVAANPMA